MKKIIALFIFFLIGSVNAQIINFSDANLKAKLLSASLTNTVATDINHNPIIIDTNADGEIQVNEALLVYSLNVSSSNISSLQGLNHFTNLIELYCQNNILTTLDVAANTNLYYINCNSNLLTTIDTSTLSDLGFGLSCNDNLLTDLNLKGIGNTFQYQQNGLAYANNPNLNYISIRDNIPALASYIQDINLVLEMDDCVVNSYCSFTPGGTTYTIHGSTRYDENANGCDPDDINFAHLKINLTDGSNSGTVIANGSGNYTLPVSAGTHTITPVLENPTYFNISPVTINVSFPATVSPFIQNFCLSSNGTHNDLAVELIPITTARTGYDSQYKIKYTNKGTHTQSGSVSFTFQDAVLDVVSSNPAATTTAPNTMTWSFTNLQPFESREISVVLNLNSPVETPPLNSGDVLAFNASVIGLTDETPADNDIIVNQLVSNSFDPNDKTCLEGAVIHPSKIGDYVHYMIRFENSGTANAQNIVVKDVIDSTKFDMASLQFVDGSHSCFTRISNTNQVEFIFEGINLPYDDANNDGYVVFKIKSKSTLVVGDQISNDANIYFDYNAPIVTNTAISTFQLLSTGDFDFNNYFTLSPNPASNILTINTQTDIQITAINIYNNLGQLVRAAIGQNNEIDVAQLKAGVYFIRITSDKGIANSSFIKE